MKILVIGANGRLGRACVSSLHKKSHSVVAFVRDKQAYPEELQKLCEVVIEADARDVASIEGCIRDFACDGVVQAGGYTPFWFWQKTDLPLIFAATLDACETVGSERSTSSTASPNHGRDILPDKRLRAWMICDLQVMDSPWDSDKRVGHYLPPMFPVHETTYTIAIQRPTDNVAWSIMCPAQMLPSSHPAAKRPVTFGGPKVPHWRDTFLWVPVLGRYLNTFYVALVHMSTSYEKVADFMADDFSLGLDSGLIGKKVAAAQTP